MSESFEKLQISLKRFRDANTRLNEALAQPYNEFLRDSVIQRFEFTFELGWKTLKLALVDYGIQVAAPRLVLEEAYKTKLIDDGEIWKAMLEGRNATTHVYNESDAQVIYDQVKNYPPHFQKLIDKLSNL